MCTHFEVTRLEDWNFHGKAAVTTTELLNFWCSPNAVVVGVRTYSGPRVGSVSCAVLLVVGGYCGVSVDKDSSEVEYASVIIPDF